MASIANNDYHAIAKQLLAEGADVNTAPTAEDTASTDLMSVLEEVEAQMREENPEAEGGDAWLAERTNRIIDAVDPSVFFSLSAEELADVAGLTIDGEEAEIYNAADPQTRAQMIDFINESAGMGSLEEFVKDAPTSK